LAGNLVKPLLSLYGTEWRERGYGLCTVCCSPVIFVVQHQNRRMREEEPFPITLSFGAVSQ
jgi:hypothetical protein